MDSLMDIPRVHGLYKAIVLKPESTWTVPHTEWTWDLDN